MEKVPQANDHHNEPQFMDDDEDEMPPAESSSSESESENKKPGEANVEPHEPHLKKRKSRKEKSSQEDDSADLRLCVQGVREFTKDYEIIKDLEKMFNGEDLGIVSIIKEPKRSYFFLKFSDKVLKEKFIAKGSINLRNRQLKFKDAKVSRGSLRKERKIQDLKDFVSHKADSDRTKISNILTSGVGVVKKEEVLSLLKERICSYKGIQYQEQVKMKREKLQDQLKEIKKIGLGRLKDEEKMTMEWLKSKTEEACPVKDFIDCDEDNRSQYRSKTEYSIGKSVVDGMIQVGFIISDKEKGYSTIEIGDTVYDPATIPLEVFKISKITSEILNKKLDWPVYDRIARTGFWRHCVVRISKRTKEMVINFVCNLKHFAELKPEEIVKVFKDQFVAKFLESLKEDSYLTAVELRGLTLQHSDASSDSIPYVEDTELVLVHGSSKTYHEILCGNNFEVSSSSFLQINIPQSEKMYQYVTKCIDLDPNTILLDICSGIGTIGISIGKNCKKVIGIEMVKSSCQNALKNAARNDMAEKYEVVEGKVEDKIEEIAAKYSAQGIKIVGVIDPPRAGLHPDVIRCLRTCKGLDNLIFICCDIKQSKTNIIDLCLPQNKRRRGPPFSPVFCSGIDMFPQTPHFESLFYLKRLYEDMEPPV